MELNVYNLVIEATRKCNMKCEHCLRGPSQRKSANHQHIYKLLQLVDQASTLTITGGEPTLAMDILEHIRHCVLYGNCDVGSFFMVTNGKSINVEAVAKWAAGMKYACSDNEISAIGFSFDQWHKNELNSPQINKQRRNFYNLKDTLEWNFGICDSGCGNFVVEHSGDSWGYHSLIKQGRAKDFGTKEKCLEDFEIEDYNETIETISITEGSLCLTCSGYIIAGCDWSYNTMDNNKRVRIAHIDDINCTDDLIEAIKKYQKKLDKAAENAAKQLVEA